MLEALVRLGFDGLHYACQLIQNCHGRRDWHFASVQYLRELFARFFECCVRR